MGAKEGAGGFLVGVPPISLGWGKSKVSFKLPILLPGSLGLGALPIQPPFCIFPGLVPSLIPLPPPNFPFGSYCACAQ